MIKEIEKAAEAVGITAVITNSTEKLETQLNRIMRIESLPAMLISWDMESTLEFDDNGFLNNPKTKIVLLLLTKAEDTEKATAEAAAEEMGFLFQQFVQTLFANLVPYQRTRTEPALTGVGYTLAPLHGAGKHSGILGRFTMSSEVANCKALNKK